MAGLSPRRELVRRGAAIVATGTRRVSVWPALGILSDDDTAPGAGVDVYLTRNVVFYSEGTYLLAKSDLNKFRMAPIAFGFQYRFD